MKLVATTLLGLWVCSGAFAAERLHNPVHPSWSPDGKTITYEAGAKGDRQIVALSVQTLEITSLTRGSHTLVAPAFSRDGDHIAFLRMGDVIELMVMGDDGSSPRRLAEVLGAPSLLTWTLDGRIGIVSATEILSRRHVLALPVIPWLYSCHEDSNLPTRRHFRCR